jgi:CheY-like chemotaxis protein
MPAESGTPGTLLVVDDEDGVRRAARAALEARGYTVLTARNGVEALLLAEHHRGEIHLLVTDLAMPPYMDGAALARALRGARPGIRVLFMAAAGQAPGFASRGNRQGTLCPVPPHDAADACFLAKPFTPESLVERVRDMLAEPVAPETREGADVLGEPGGKRAILVMAPHRDLRSSVAALLRDEGYQVLEVRHPGEALRVCEWHAGEIGLLLADRDAFRGVPEEVRERIAEVRPSMRVLSAAIPGPVQEPLGERVRHALEGWGLEARGGS